MATVGFKTKDGKTVSFTTKKRATRRNSTAQEITTYANKRKAAPKKRAAPKRKPVARKPAASGKDKASYNFYVVFRGPPNGVNIHAGFATQQAARAFITKKFKGTRRLQVRGRPGLVKSGHNPKVAKNWKTFSLAASLKALPAPRKRATTRRNSGGDSRYDLAPVRRSRVPREWTMDPWETCIWAAERADNEARKASYRGDVDEARRLRAQRDVWLAQAETHLRKNRGRR